MFIARENIYNPFIFPSLKIGHFAKWSHAVGSPGDADILGKKSSKTTSVVANLCFNEIACAHPSAPRRADFLEVSGRCAQPTTEKKKGYNETTSSETCTRNTEFPDVASSFFQKLHKLNMHFQIYFFTRESTDW